MLLNCACIKKDAKSAHIMCQKLRGIKKVLKRVNRLAHKNKHRNSMEMFITKPTHFYKHITVVCCENAFFFKIEN